MVCRRLHFFRVGLARGPDVPELVGVFEAGTPLERTLGGIAGEQEWIVQRLRQDTIFIRDQDIFPLRAFFERQGGETVFNRYFLESQGGNSSMADALLSWLFLSLYRKFAGFTKNTIIGS